MRIRAKDLVVSVQKKIILEGVAIAVNDGEVVGILGPNGSGKSTLVKTLYKSMTPVKGIIELEEGKSWFSLDDMNQMDVARKIAVVPQELDLSFGFSVREVVAMGRSPYHRGFSGLGEEDNRVIEHALRLTGADNFYRRNFMTLSGGEKKRTLIARSLAQDTPILLLDEPTNHLDLEGTYDLMSIIRELGKTTICVLHDLNLALEYCDRVYILQNGRIVHEGTPREALEADNIRNVFGVDSEVTSGPDGQGNRLVFARRKD